MPESFPNDVLRRLITSHIDVGGSLLRFDRISTGHFNTTYTVQGAPRPLILRIAPPDDAGFVFYERGMMAQEPEIHAIVRERTSAPVAEILAYDTSRKHIDRDYLLMERLPGIPLMQFSA
ncbi:MAG: phosphotransferase family protein, partial [Armatimonadota bacterium]